MTVENTTNFKRVEGDGITDEISFTFKVLQESDLAVYSIVRATGVATKLSSGYTVTLADDEEGGTVNFTSPPASTVDILLINELELTQTADLPAEGNFNETSVEQALDRAVLLIIQQQEIINRCMKLSKEDENNVTGYAGLFLPADLQATRASKLIGWNDDGDELVHYAAADLDLTAVSAFVTTLIDDADAGTFLSTLGISAFIQTLLDDADAATARATLDTFEDVFTTIGDLLIAGTSGAEERLAAGSQGQALIMGASKPQWGYFPFKPGFFTGFETVNGTDADHDIDFGAGRGLSSDGTMVIVNSSTVTKQADATWAAGSAAGGMASGQSLPTSGTIHYFALGNPTTGGVDFGFDTAVAGTNLLADAAVASAGFTKIIYIGSMTTDSSANITKYFQYGSRFILDVEVRDVTASNPGTSAVTRTLSVPNGVKVLAILNAFGRGNTTADIAYLITAIEQTDTTPSSGAAQTFRTVGDTGDGSGVSNVIVATNTSRQIRSRQHASGASDAFLINTVGWINPAGRM